MSRVINPNQPGKLRKQILKALTAAMAAYTELASSTAPTGEEPEIRDLVAFALLSLQRIHETVTRTIEPWEKRGYWVKADRFRLEWIWAERLARALAYGVEVGDWEQISAVLAELSGELGREEPLKKYVRSAPWQGSWDVLVAQRAERGRAG